MAPQTNVRVVLCYKDTNLLLFHFAGEKLTYHVKKIKQKKQIIKIIKQTIKNNYRYEKFVK